MPSSANIEKLEKKLSFLPGHTFHKDMDNYRKSHAFDYLASVPTFSDNKPGIGGKPLAHQQQGEEKTLTSVDFLHEKSKLDEKSKVAGWIAFDKQVLRFHAYFRESFPENQTEPFRIRKVDIYFYVEDDSMHVSEPRTANSGLPQGTLIRRHRIPLPTSTKNQHYTIADLNVGNTITIYARQFVIVGCDEFTRRFLNNVGITVGPSGTIPEGPFEVQHKQSGAPKAAIQHLVPTPHTTSLKKFLENDRHVLRFYCVWDDSSAKYGDVHPMVLHYFLADDTVEIREQHIPHNAGHGNMSIPTTVFLKRHRLSKRPLQMSVDGSHLSPDPTEDANAAYYNDKDFTVGSVVHFYGRTFVVCDCDAFTKEYYQTKYGVRNFATISMDEYGCIDAETGAVVKRTHSEDKHAAALDHDQVVTFSSSNTAHKSDKKKGVDENLVLRFLATLNTNKQIDKDRKFVVSYYFVNDTFQVFEKQGKNSGITGGKFLERSKIKAPNSTDFYGPAHLKIGAELIFWSHHFVLVDADEFTKGFMAQNAHIFTAAKATPAK